MSDINSLAELEIAMENGQQFEIFHSNTGHWSTIDIGNVLLYLVIDAILNFNLRVKQVRS